MRGWRAPFLTSISTSRPAVPVIPHPQSELGKMSFDPARCWCHSLAASCVTACSNPSSSTAARCQSPSRDANLERFSCVWPLPLQFIPAMPLCPPETFSIRSRTAALATQTDPRINSNRSLVNMDSKCGIPAVGRHGERDRRGKAVNACGVCPVCPVWPYRTSPALQRIPAFC